MDATKRFKPLVFEHSGFVRTLFSFHLGVSISFSIQEEILGNFQELFSENFGCFELEKSPTFELT